MKPVRLMHLFHHIAHEAACPQCGQHIDIESIKLESTTDDSAFLHMNCQHCGTSSHASVMINVVDPLKVQAAERPDTDMTESECYALNAAIESHQGGISNLFSENNA